MSQSDQINELAKALAAAQGVMKSAHEDSTNPHFGNRFASLTAVLNAIKGPLSSNGLAVVQATQLQDSRVILETTLMHASGQWIRSSYPINPVKQDPQGYGAALTYGKRYALSAMVGISSDEDDDGNAASIPPARSNYASEDRPSSTMKAKPMAKAGPSPIKPISKPAEKVWEPNETELAPVGLKSKPESSDALTVAATRNGWTSSQMVHYCQTAWGKSRRTELTEAESEKFLAAVQAGSYSAAMTALNLDVG